VHGTHAMLQNTGSERKIRMNGAECRVATEVEPTLVLQSA